MATSLVTAPLEIGAGLLTSAGGSALGFIAVAAVSGRAASASSPMGLLGLNVQMGVVALGVCDGELVWLLPAAEEDAAFHNGSHVRQTIQDARFAKSQVALGGRVRVQWGLPVGESAWHGVVVLLHVVPEELLAIGHRDGGCCLLDHFRR